MQDISEFLLNDEKCLHQSRPHWVVYGLPSMFASLTVASLFVPFSIIEITLLLGAFTFITTLFSAASRQFTVYAITNKRILRKTGIISRNTSGLLLDKIESVDVTQTITGRVFGFGNVIIRGTGGGVDAYFKVEKPFEFRRQLADVLSKR